MGGQVKLGWGPLLDTVVEEPLRMPTAPCPVRLSFLLAHIPGGSG